MKKCFLLIALAGVLLTSCKKCKDCEYKVDWQITDGLSAEDLAMNNAQYQLLYGMDYEEYLQQGLFTPSSAEYCGDDLDAIEATADVNITGLYRFYWECK